MKEIVQKINAYHEEQNRKEPPARFHMGASSLGNPDDLELWLSFRWAFKQNFDGRVLRLFRRGHREEETVISDLRAAGIDVREHGENQRRLNFGAHVEGSCDGVIYNGIPDAPTQKHLLEIKTMSKKKFDELIAKGLQAANFLYWVQVHCYMFGAKLGRCLFVAVCKDDDRMYTELIDYNAEYAVPYIERGKRIALADYAPDREYFNADDWRVKFSYLYAAYFPVSATQSHWDRLVSQRESTDVFLSKICINYRNDARTTVRDDGTFYSERFNSVVPRQNQHQHDDGHVLHPSIMALAGWELLPSDHHEDVALWRLPSGAEVLNGHHRHGTKDRAVFTSEELLSNPEACAAFQHDRFAIDLREEMGARVTGSGGIE